MRSDDARESPWANAPRGAARHAIVRILAASCASGYLPAAKVGVLALASDLHRDWWPQEGERGVARGTRGGAGVHSVVSIATADGGLRLALSLGESE